MKNCLQSRIFYYFYDLNYELLKNDTKFFFYTLLCIVCKKKFLNKFYWSWFFLKKLHYFKNNLK
jgi:hypothetical protein